MTTGGVTVAVRLAGDVRVTHDGPAVHPRVIGGRRCVAVLSYLVVNRHRDVTLVELSEVLWAQARPQSWYAALRGVLSRVRDTLETAGLPTDSVRSRGGIVRLVLPAGTTTDVEAARRLSDAAYVDAADAVRDARAALDLLSEPVLRDVDGRWADDVRDQAAQLRLRALEIDAEGSVSTGEFGHAVVIAEDLIASDPLRESAYRIAMRAHLALGERARALDVAARCRRLLAEELGVAPSTETEDLYLAALGGDVAPEVVPIPVAAPRPEFIGRATELAMIVDAIGHAERGEGQVVIVSGEAGSGKSTVVHEAMRRAQAAGAVVLHGRCSEEAVIPFEPLVEAIGNDIAVMDPEEVRERLAADGPDILRLVPHLARRFGEIGPPAGVDDRAAVMAAVVNWLADTAHTTPTVLVVDDLHWASLATLAVLRYVIHASESSRLCVLLTVRDEHPDSGAIRSTMAAAGRPGGVHRIRLGGLSPAEVGAIVEASGTSLDPVTLYERTHGVPLFVESLIASRLSGSHDDLPASVAESVIHRERLLGPDAAGLLRICAVVGMSAHRVVVRTVASDLDDVAFAESLDELVHHRLVVESDGGTHVMMRHPLVQEAVYAEIPGSQRSALHSRVARALADLGDVGVAEEYARLAYHLSRGRDADRARAADHWWKAGGSAVAIGAYEDAVAFYRSADERLLPRGDSEQRCRLWVDLGRAQRKARDPDFRPTLLGASDMARRLGDVDLQVTATLANDLQGILYIHIRSDGDRISDLYDAIEALEATGRGDTADGARLLAQLATELIWTSDHSTRQALLARSIAAARVCGDRSALVAALSAVGIALRVPQWSQFRRACYDELMTLLASATDRRLDPSTAVWIARQQIEYGELRAATATMSTVTAAQLARDQELSWLARNVTFSIDLAAGRLVRCDQTFDSLRDIPSSPIEGYSFGRLLGPVLALRALRGDMAEVVAARAAIVERFDVVDTYRACLATALVDVGDMDEAVDLVSWYDRSRLEKIPVNTLWLATIATIGRVAAQVGNAEVSAVAHEMIAPFAGENTISWASVFGTVHHHLGETAIAFGDFAAAAQHLDAAMIAHRDRGFDGWYAETLYLVARLELHRDGRASAESVARARRAANEVGATAVLRRVDALLD